MELRVPYKPPNKYQKLRKPKPSFFNILFSSLWFTVCINKKKPLIEMSVFSGSCVVRTRLSKHSKEQAKIMMFRPPKFHSWALGRTSTRLRFTQQQQSKKFNYLNEIIDIPYSGSYLSTSPNTISKVPEKKVNINFVLNCKELHFHVT